jgi:hypothetical protein
VEWFRARHSLDGAEEIFQQLGYCDVWVERMPAKLANAYLKRGSDLKKGRLVPSAQLLVQPGSPKGDTCERL